MGVDPIAILEAPRNRLPVPDAHPSVKRAEQGEELSEEDRDHALFIRLSDYFTEGREMTADTRQDWQRWQDFFTGKQFTDDDEAALAADNRPKVIFNRSAKNIHYVHGTEIQNRQEVGFLPREVGDAGKSEILSGAVEYINDVTHASDEKSEAFRDLLICGIGWTETVMDYLNYERGMPVEHRRDPVQMYYDPWAQKRNLSDRRWCARAINLPLEEGERLFPDVDPSELHAAWAMIDDERDPEPHRQTYIYDVSDERTQALPRGRVSIVEIQWFDIETRVILKDLYTGQTQEFDSDRARSLMRMFPGRYKGTPVERKCYYRAFLGARLLRKVKLERVKGFTFKPMTGTRDRHGGYSGLIALMEDPQKWANKWLSQTMHLLNTGAKNSHFFETGSIVDPARAEADIQTPGALVEVEEGALASGKIQPITRGQFPQELDKLLPFALESIQDCVGVNQEMLGRSTGMDMNRAAALEANRRRAGLTLMAWLFESKRLFVKQQGELLLRYIMEFMNDGRLIRINSEGAKQYVQLLIEDPESIEYDIVVDETPDSPTQKLEIWEQVLPLFDVLQGMQVPPAVYMRLLKFGPFPASLIAGIEEELAKSAEQAEQDPDPEEIKLEAEIAEIKANIAKVQAETARLMSDRKRLDSAATLNIAKAHESRGRVQMDALEGIRETIAVDDARERGKLTTHENA